MIKGQISGKLVSSGTSHVAFASVILRENPSEEVDNWASEASPTLGCSIEISRDIYIYVYMLSVCRSMSVVCQINCVGEIMWPTRMLKVFWGRLNQ